MNPQALTSSRNSGQSVTPAGTLAPIQPIQASLNELEQQICHLDNAIGCLESKLSPVMAAEHPKPASDDKSPPYCGSTLRGNIEGYTAMLQQFTSRVNEIRDRLEC
jgi:hypothetical protein